MRERRADAAADDFVGAHDAAPDIAPDVASFARLRRGERLMSLDVDTCRRRTHTRVALYSQRRVTVANLQRKLDAAEASAAREMNAMRLKLDAAEASAAALTAALVECRVAAADEHLHRMRAEQTETPTALLDCSFASRRRASGLMPG